MFRAVLLTAKIVQLGRSVHVLTWHLCLVLLERSVLESRLTVPYVQPALVARAHKSLLAVLARWQNRDQPPVHLAQLAFFAHFVTILFKCLAQGVTTAVQVVLLALSVQLVNTQVFLSSRRAITALVAPIVSEALLNVSNALLVMLALQPPVELWCSVNLDSTLQIKVVPLLVKIAILAKHALILVLQAQYKIVRRAGIVVRSKSFVQSVLLDLHVPPQQTPVKSLSALLVTSHWVDSTCVKSVTKGIIARLKHRA